jgi:DNA (cytosine-5)-methyltransferase 1
MPSKKSYLTASDQFCGCGGSSSGAEESGFEIALALNHWKLAIETHNTNFPNARHDCTDVSACDPRRYPSTDILITSPECTNHSVANGKKKAKAQMDLFNSGKQDAAAERSRATMWDVVRFAEYHQYNAIITENVVDARKWVLYDAWINAMHNLGYNHKCCFLNSMHFWPTPQSRDRMYVVFWKKGNKAPDLEYTPLAHCPKCECNVNAIQSWKKNQKSWKYGNNGGYVYCCPVCTTIVEPYYYAAFNCIDWSIPGKRIGDRKIPLKGNTERRIRKGIKMFPNYPFNILSAYGETARGDVRSCLNPLYTQTTYDMQGVVQPFMVNNSFNGDESRIIDLRQANPSFTTQLNQGLVQPFIINNQQQDSAEHRIKGSMQDVLPTCSTYANFGLLAPAPIIIKGEHTGSESGSYVRSSLEAMQTQTTSDGSGILTSKPMIVELNSTGKAFPAAEKALSCLTAGGNNQGLFTMPVMVENKGQSTARRSTEAAGTFTTKTHHGILTDKAFESFLTYQNGGSDVNSHITRPAGAFATNDRHALVSYTEPEYEDCYYRTLKAHEVKKGMAFQDGYIVLGTSKEQVKQAGNAVTPPVMKWLTQRVKESLE